MIKKQKMKIVQLLWNSYIQWGFFMDKKHGKGIMYDIYLQYAKYFEGNFAYDKKEGTGNYT